MRIISNNESAKLHLLRWGLLAAFHARPMIPGTVDCNLTQTPAGDCLLAMRWADTPGGDYLLVIGTPGIDGTHLEISTRLLEIAENAISGTPRASLELAKTGANNN